MKFTKEYIEKCIQARESLGLSRSDMARKIECSLSAVCRFEDGERAGSLVGIAYSVLFGFDITRKDLE